ncbi:MAG: succinate dehydrogenase assembly factor 2 [Burkholderiaceae bacterium]
MTSVDTAGGSAIEEQGFGVSGDQPAPEDWIRRIRWRARRGLLENDLLISRYLEHRGDALTRDDHDGLAEILELSDNDLLDVLVDRKRADEIVVSPLAQRVLSDIKGT